MIKIRSILKSKSKQSKYHKMLNLNFEAVFVLIFCIQAPKETTILRFFASWSSAISNLLDSLLVFLNKWAQD